MSTMLVPIPSSSPCAEQDELTRVFHRQGPQHHRIHQAEDGSIRADAERERKQCDDDDAGAAQHRAQSVEHVLQEAFEPAPAPCDIATLTQEGRIAKAAMSRGSRVIRRDACFDLLLPAQLEVESHLLFEVL